VLNDEPRDSMVIATPWAEDPTAFYYNQKIVAMRAMGSFSVGDLRHTFNSQSAFGLLDRSGFKRGTGAVVCMRERVGYASPDSLYVPVWML